MVQFKKNEIYIHEYESAEYVLCLSKLATPLRSAVLLLVTIACLCSQIMIS